MNKKQKISKSDLISTLKGTVVSKEACSQYKSFDNIKIIETKV
jgi:hypothetical protein